MLNRLYKHKSQNARLRPKTVRQCGWMIKPVQRLLGDTPLQLVSREVVLDYVRDRLADGKAPATVQGEIRMLREGLKLAQVRNWWDGDVVALCGSLCLNTAPEKRWLRREDVERFMQAIDDPWFRIAAWLALHWRQALPCWRFRGFWVITARNSRPNSTHTLAKGALWVLQR